MGLGLWSMLIRVLKILFSLEDLMGEVVKLLGNKQPGRDNLGERDVSKALEISGAMCTSSLISVIMEAENGIGSLVNANKGTEDFILAGRFDG